VQKLIVSSEPNSLIFIGRTTQFLKHTILSEVKKSNLEKENISIISRITFVTLLLNTIKIDFPSSLIGRCCNEASHLLTYFFKLKLYKTLHN